MSRTHWLNSIQFLALRRLDLVNLVGGLEVQPELLGSAEELRQPDSGVSRNTPFLQDDIIHPRRGNSNPLR